MVEGMLLSLIHISPGWHLVDNKWRHFDQAGLLELGWKWINGNWYYLDPATGDMQTGLKNINNNVYYLNNSGAMVTGWQDVYKRQVLL